MVLNNHNGNGVIYSPDILNIPDFFIYKYINKNRKRI